MESNDSPEIPDRGETSDIPGLPSGTAKERFVLSARYGSVTRVTLQYHMGQSPVMPRSETVQTVVWMSSEALDLSCHKKEASMLWTNECLE